MGVHYGLSVDDCIDKMQWTLNPTPATTWMHLEDSVPGDVSGLGCSSAHSGGGCGEGRAGSRMELGDRLDQAAGRGRGAVGRAAAPAAVRGVRAEERGEWRVAPGL